jgi:hypothetical protein
MNITFSQQDLRHRYFHIPEIFVESPQRHILQGFRRRFQEWFPDPMGIGFSGFHSKNIVHSHLSKVSTMSMPHARPGPLPQERENRLPLF